MQRVLIIGKVWPEPTSSAAGSRTLELIEVFQAMQFKVVFASAAAQGEFCFDLSRLAVESHHITLNDPSFDSFVTDLQPQVVIFDRFITEEQFGWRVREACPDALRILDTIDLHGLRRARHDSVKKGVPFSTHTLWSHESAVREIASIYRCDLSLMISDAEMRILDEVFKVPAHLLHYTPFMLEPLSQAQADAWPGFEQRNGFVSIGNFLHEPNWDAVLWLKTEIWPLIHKQLPKAELLVYGAYPSQKVYQLHNPSEGFLIKGRAESASEVMKTARVCLAPLRFGAGLKGKLIDAMCNGTPSVTTSVGAEGMHSTLAWAGTVVDEATDIAQAAVDLYTQPHVWKIAAEQGVEIINKVFSKSEHSANLVNKITWLLNHLEDHRRQNFVGHMLAHQGLAATKYMALYIEAKNKTSR